MDKHNIITKLSIYKRKSDTTKNKLQKDNNIHFKESLNLFFRENPNILNNIDYKYINYINIFLNTLQNKNPSINLNLFYKNLKTLSIKEKKNFNRLIFFSTNIQGVFKLKKNRIELLDKNYNFCVFHELLHCASYKKDETVYCTGFFRQYSKFSIGRALNEGYTSLLEKRYFSETFHKNHYGNIKIIVEKIEKLIGKEVMENFYFTANLNGLINEFVKYGKAKQEIIFFIDELDYVKYNLGDPENQSFCQDALYNITNFLIECYRKKCFIENKTDNDLNAFINNFQTQINSNKIQYKFLSDDFDVDQTNKIKNYYIEDVYNYRKHYKR